MELNSSISRWKASARLKVQERSFGLADLDELPGFEAGMKQRLLYVHSDGMHPGSEITAALLVEPVAGGADVQLEPAPVMPYASVHQALIDGWRIVHFPRQNTEQDDRSVGIVGYEWILEKMELAGD